MMKPQVGGWTQTRIAVAYNRIDAKFRLPDHWTDPRCRDLYPFAHNQTSRLDHASHEVMEW
jgi:hypothetical protein